MVTIPAAVVVLLACVALVEAVALVWLTLSLLDWKVKAESQKARTDHLERLIEQLQSGRDNYREFLMGEKKRLEELESVNTETIARLSVEKSKALDDVLAAEEVSKGMGDIIRTVTTERDQATTACGNLSSECASLGVKLAEETSAHQASLRTIERLNKLIESHAETSCGPNNTQIQQALERARGQFKDGIDDLVMTRAFNTLRDGLDSAMKQLQRSLISGVDRIGGELRTSLLNPEGEEVRDVQRFGDEDEETVDYGNDEDDEDDDVEDPSDLDDEDDSELEDNSDWDDDGPDVE